MRRLTPLSLILCALSYTASAQNEKPLINSGALISEAIKLHDQGKYKDALAAYRQISRNDTNYVYALYEAALSLQADSQFVEAIRFCEEGLKQKGEREREPDLYTQLGSSLDNSGDKTRALRVFDSALQKYPTHVPLLFNKAITLMRLEKNEEATKILQQALLISPYHASSHFRLGQLAIKAGRPVEGFMSLASYLIMAPGGANQSQAITVMNAIALCNEDIVKPIRSRTVTLPENLQDVETIVLSKIALNKNYKPLLKLDDAISRQLQVICEKVVYDKDEKDFWMQFYVPLFSRLIKEDRFEPFVNFIFSNVNIEAIQKYNKSRKKELTKFSEDVVAYFEEVKSTRELNFEKRKTTRTRYRYNDENYGGGTTADDGTMIKSWQYFYNSGNKLAEGEYNSKGEKEGFWKYYYYNGQLKGTEYLKNGKAEGESVDYYENGNKSEEGVFKNGKKEGEYKTFFYSGGPNKIMHFKNDELEGLVTTFYATGGLKEEQEYKAGKQHGTYKSYHANGKKQAVAAFENDVENGPAAGFYPNGNKSFEGRYVGGKNQGEWKRWYKDGKPQSIENYDQGEYDGEYIAYHENGQLHYKTNYKKGLTSGEVVYFSEDGKPASIYVFEKNNPRSVRFLDENGKEVGKSVMQSKKMHLVAFLPNGIKQTEKDINDKGEVNGIQTDYYTDGSVKSTAELVSSVSQGKAIGYYIGGQKNYETNYTNGERDGYYREYHQNGKISAEGWFKNDGKTGDWYYYDEHGNLVSKDHLAFGELHGVTQQYYPGNRLKSELVYHYGWIIGSTQFDTLGNVLVNSNLATSSGTLLLKNFNGKDQTVGTLVNGNWQGPKPSYYPNGSINMTQSYLNDKLHGEVKVFHPNGQPQTQGMFEHGEKQGPWKFYNSKGVLSTVDEYLDDELHGKSVSYYKNGKVDVETDYTLGLRQGLRKKFDTEGQLLYQIRYRDNLPVAYTYPDKSGKLLPEILLVGGTGKVSTFYPNGKPCAIFNYVAGKLHGRDLQYYSDGQLWIESDDKYGETFGPIKSYHANGKLSYSSNYLYGNEHGGYKYFNQDGQLTEEGQRYNGEFHGERKFYDEKGKLTNTYTYYYGTLVTMK